MSLKAEISAFVIIVFGVCWSKRKGNGGAHLVMAVLSLIVLFNVLVNAVLRPEPVLSGFLLDIFFLLDFWYFPFVFSSY